MGTRFLFIGGQTDTQLAKELAPCEKVPLKNEKTKFTYGVEIFGMLTNVAASLIHPTCIECDVFHTIVRTLIVKS